MHSQKKGISGMQSSSPATISLYLDSEVLRNPFWDRTYAEPYWSALKGLGFIISQQDNPIQKAKELISKFKTIHQGWKPSKIDFLPLINESFIC